MKVKYLKSKIIVSCLSLVSIGLSAIIPFLVKQMMEYINNSQVHDMYIIAVVIFVAIPLRKFFDFLFNYQFNNLFNFAAHDKRSDCLKHILNSSITNADIIDSNVINNRLMNEIYAYGTIDGIKEIMLLINSVMIVVSVFVLCRINIYLFAITVVIVPCIYVAITLLKKKIEKASLNQRYSYDRLSFLTRKISKGFSNIKMLNSELFFARKFDELNDSYYNSERKVNLVQRISNDIFDILFSVLPIMLLVAVFILSTKSYCDVASSIAFYMYLSFFIEPITNLTNYHVQMITAKQKASMVENEINKFSYDDSKKKHKKN